MTTTKKPSQQHEDLARALTAGITSFSSIEPRDVISQRLREAGFGGYVQPPAKAQEARVVDPNGDPLASLSPEEREAVAADPKLKARFLAKVEAAEKTVRAEAERQRNLEEVWAAHDRLAHVDELAERTVTERATARSR
jgi:hypothetical protein